MTLINQSVFASLKEMSGDELLTELIDVFLVDSQRMIAEMQAALDARDVDAFRRNAHSLKSNAETFGATDLATQARDLEVIARAGTFEVGDRLDLLRQAAGPVFRELEQLRP